MHTNLIFTIFIFHEFSLDVNFDYRLHKWLQLTWLRFVYTSQKIHNSQTFWRSLATFVTSVNTPQSCKTYRATQDCSKMTVCLSMKNSVVSEWFQQCWEAWGGIADGHKLTAVFSFHYYMYVHSWVLRYHLYLSRTKCTSLTSTSVFPGKCAGLSGGYNWTSQMEVFQSM